MLKRVEARNKLENYCFSVRSTMLNDEKMKSALGEDAETVDKQTQEALDWLDESDERTTEEYETRYQELEKVLMPLVQKAYQSTVPTSEEQEAPQESVPEEPSTGPKVEEVD